ncbi:MAG: hypothetical protein JWM96_1014, partial [Alphaproteobacteria bacterium]|nr:hypothetical protein [Alphaproteobacteria bacterium]
LSNVTAIQINPTTKMELGAFVNDKDLFHPIFQAVDQESTDFGGFSRVEKKFTALNLDHKILGGINYHAGKVDALQFINVRGSRGIQTADTDQKSQNVALYGEGQFHVARDLSLILGGQGLWANRNFINNRNASASDEENFTGFNPKIGTLWDVTAASQVFANISRSSEVPTFSELVQQPVVGFVPLDTQTAWTAEIGTRGSKGNLTWDLTAYHARIENELLQFTTNSTIPATTFNADQTIHQGLELGSAWRFTHNLWRMNDSLTLSQIYNLNDFRFQDDPQFGDNELAGIPRHVLRSELRYKQEKWSTAPIMEWAPEAPFVDFANTTKATDFMILNLEAQRKITDRMEIFFEARNLLDQRFISNFSTVTNAGTGPSPAIFYPGEGRSFFGGLKVKF